MQGLHLWNPLIESGLENAKRDMKIMVNKVQFLCF